MTFIPNEACTIEVNLDPEQRRRRRRHRKLSSSSLSSSSSSFNPVSVHRVLKQQITNQYSES
jgi:hypothetical protein